MQRKCAGWDPLRRQAANAYMPDLWLAIWGLVVDSLPTWEKQKGQCYCVSRQKLPHPLALIGSHFVYSEVFFLKVEVLSQ